MLSTLELAHLIVTIKQPNILSILELAHLNVTYKQPIINYSYFYPLYHKINIEGKRYLSLTKQDGERQVSIM